MTDEQYRWYMSQYNWHSRRVGIWHGQQTRWYRKHLRKASITNIVTFTIHKNFGKLAKSVAETNALYKSLKERT